MWIKHIPVRHKILPLLALLFLFAFLFAYGNVEWKFFAAGALSTCLVYTAFLAFRLGVVIRKYSFKTKKGTFDILDSSLPGTPIRIQRSLIERGTNTVQSRMFLRPGSVWAHYDIVRQLSKHVPRLARTLILGGGAGVTGQLLSSMYGARADIVELSADMIRISKKYFFPDNNPLVLYHHTNAAAFVANTKETYDLIFLDIFHGNKLDKDITSEGFFRDIKRLVSPNGILICNLSDDIVQLDALLPPAADDITYGLWQGMIMGFWSRHPVFLKRALQKQRVMLIPNRGARNSSSERSRPA